ncbi:hypothetical protein COV18_07555 [Candidatus Woesearchaeota archaeon CG10_big_fil_rev_8_21_14_0_10_37_12]|nr:MAG: hypothetical protein COV18_07555 [Candidatus Woesearchaeota archaeon CG10_big_fil_rev_8_21_14_0_10_37_12]
MSNDPELIKFKRRVLPSEISELVRFLDDDDGFSCVLDEGRVNTGVVYGKGRYPGTMLPFELVSDGTGYYGLQLKGSPTKYERVDERAQARLELEIDGRVRCYFI